VPNNSRTTQPPVQIARQKPSGVQTRPDGQVLTGQLLDVSQLPTIGTVEHHRPVSSQPVVTASHPRFTQSSQFGHGTLSQTDAGKPTTSLQRPPH
jgi:hypothetical protein